MLKIIYTRALKVLMKKPLALWGISLLNLLLVSLVSALCGVVPILAIAITLLLNTSMTMVYLHGYREEEVKSVQLFDSFKDWATVKRVLCGMGWMSLWIFLWGLIPVAGPIFAIIRTYEYRLVPYILVTEPDVAPTEAIKISKERTQGYKGKMFLADLLVGVLFGAASLVLGLLGTIPYVGPLFLIVFVLLVIAYVILAPLFLGLVQAAFYEEIKNPTIAIVQTSSAPGIFCPNCGNAVAADSAFCPNCGNKLN